MNCREIPIVTVTYNAPELLIGLLTSLRKFYINPVYVMDGSDGETGARTREIAQGFESVQVKSFGFNIHHGPGMAWAIENLGLKGPVLFLDNDIVVLRAGFMEAMLAELRDGDYGVGGVGYVNQEGFDIEYGYGAIPYLHPPCMLCNAEVMRQWPLPIKHGAPMVESMRALHRAGKSGLLRHLDWTANDVKMGTKKVYVDHIGQGTSAATGGYHLDEWMAEVQARRAREANHPAPTGFNPDLMAMIPVGVSRILEIGCSTGALAFAYRSNHPNCSYHGVEIDDHAAAIARRYCDQVSVLDMDTLPASYFSVWSDRDCWLFGDVLEHLRDPWRILSHIYTVMPSGSCVVASVPNAQHWSLQAKLSVGDFRYADGGLFDRTHLRWFTRVTLLEMFTQAGFRIDSAVSRIFNEPQREQVLPAIRAMAQSMGGDPEQAAKDALALQYVVRAVRP
jgi:SAM-dependent methyltransferase